MKTKILSQIKERIKGVTPTAGMPPIAIDDDACETWVAQLDALGQTQFAVELTFVDGGTRDATLTGAGYYGPHSLAGITVKFWEGDQEPASDALEVPVYSTDITRIRVY